MKLRGMEAIADSLTDLPVQAVESACLLQRWYGADALETAKAALKLVNRSGNRDQISHWLTVWAILEVADRRGYTLN